jgi:hypothetical protein
MRDFAVAILTQCATKMQAEHGATLIPALNASVWEQGISTRIVLFRDWVWHNDSLLGTRFAGVIKSNGKDNRRLSGNSMAPFDVTDVGTLLLPSPPPSSVES